MTWAFLIDANLPVALARTLATAGHHAVHTADLGDIDTGDAELWNIAARQALVIVSKDADFADLAARSEVGPPVVWVRVGNTRKAAIVAKFLMLLPEILEELDRGERLIEVR